jgi:hypothetical protein
MQHMYASDTYGARERLLNVPFEAATARLGEHLAGFRDIVRAALGRELLRELPGPAQLECHEDLRDCYHYGVLGQRLDDVEEAIHRVEAVLDLFSVPANDLCRRIVVAARARQALDEPENPLAPALLTLEEVAELANMDLQSVRNATRATTGDRLDVERHGTRTRIRAGVARNWLARRRSFCGTKSMGGQPGLPPGGFATRGALFAFVLDRQFERPLDTAHFVRLTEVDEGVCIGDLVAAARAWGLDPREFTAAAAVVLSEEVR